MKAVWIAASRRAASLLAMTGWRIAGVFGINCEAQRGVGVRRDRKALRAVELAVLIVIAVPGAGWATQDYGPVVPPAFFQNVFSTFLKEADTSPEQVGLTPLYCTSDSTKHPTEGCHTYWEDIESGDSQEQAYPRANGDFFAGFKQRSAQQRSPAGNQTQAIRTGGCIGLVGQNGKLLWGNMRIVPRARESGTPESPEKWQSMTTAQIAQGRTLQKAFLETVAQCESPLMHQILVAKILNAWPLSADHIQDYEKPREVTASCGFSTVVRRRERFYGQGVQGIYDTLSITSDKWGGKMIWPAGGNDLKCFELTDPFCAIRSRAMIP